MKKITNKKTIFYILYLIGFLGAGIIGLFSNSFFAYKTFSSLWAEILFTLFISMIYIAAFVQELLASPKASDAVLNGFIFIGSLILFLLSRYLGFVFVFFAVVYSAIMLALFGYKTALKLKNENVTEFKTKQFASIFSLLLFAMSAMLGAQFTNGMFYVWAVIPAAILSAAITAAAILMLRKSWQKLYDTELKRIGNAIMGIICIILIVYAYSFTATGAANIAFDNSQPTAIECTVLDTNVSAGARTVTLFTVTVSVDGKEQRITVPVTDYHEISAGDTVIINCNHGAFGFEYLTYGGTALNENEKN